MKTLEELNVMDKAELKKYAFEDLALELKGNLSEETLIERITDKQREIQLQREHDLNPAVLAEKPVVEEKPEEVKPSKEAKSRAKELEDHLKSHIDRGVGFEADDVAYTISYRGQVISGNLSVPNAIVARQADVMLSRR